MRATQKNGAPEGMTRRRLMNKLVGNTYVFHNITVIAITQRGWH
jgi:hypothetical protein